jgi:superfamily II RNA helicase
MVKFSSEIKIPETTINDIQKNYDFTLSDFQNKAIYGILTGQHVLITAHTGSGKTLPAEYAIQHFTKNKKKVIYTAPIKALSNQKFNEFTIKYPDISFGILTGDIKFNPEADVLIMTTEILRNQLLYINEKKDSNDTTNVFSNFQMDLENELGCVIFDEVHYINDLDRGKIWEETIIKLPKQVSLVMLSATIDKPEIFSKWIEERNDGKEVFLIETNHRVVPLTHYLYYTIHDSYCKNIKDANLKNIISSHINKPCTINVNGKVDESVIHKINKIDKYAKLNKFIIKRPYVLNNLVKYLNDNNMLPAITFIFSRNQVERAAKEINIDLINDGLLSNEIERESINILKKVPNYKEYVELPEFKMIINLLRKGIAIHHAGMMPIFREMVEFIFTKRYIKLLFATETFAVGINMPTKTVVFTSMFKFDGNGMRMLHPHEYTQMAGRAGRRGLDVEGHVIHCNNLYDSNLTSVDYNTLIFGRPQRLISKFQVSYNLILNLIQNNMLLLDKDNNYTTEVIERSMIKNDVDGEINQYRVMINELDKQLTCYNEINIKTPIDVCNEYINLTSTDYKLSNKERKKRERKITEIREEYKFIENDSNYILKYKQLEKKLETYKHDFKNISNYFNIQIDNWLDILIKNSFISKNESEYLLTKEGIIVSRLQEVPGHILSKFIVDSNFMEKYSSYELACIFSFFTNISVSIDESSSDYNNTENQNCEYLDKISNVNDIYNIFENEIIKYANIESKYNVDVQNIENIHKNIIQEILEWCFCENTNDCKKVIAKLELKGIFLGEFIKSILKIITITNEMIKIADFFNELEYLKKLKDIEKHLMKYVVTNSSLYI